MEGTPFGRYRLINLLGRGGMGEVWKAFDTATERVVAVKVLSAQVAADPVFEQRFRREAHAAAGLNNPHVVPIHNYGEIDGRLYVDMRLIEGQNLEVILSRGPMDAERAIRIVEQIASALNAAHRVGLIHRDVKPSNILIAEDDFAYLIDFGIARGAGETGLTSTGNVVGTWPYMAPERFTTGLTDTRCDIYALTCVLYQCLTASRPFPGDSVEQQIAGHLTMPPPRPSINRPGVSPQLDAVIATGMAKEPGDRYDTTVDLARAAKAAVTASVSPHPAVEQTMPANVFFAAPTQSAPTQARPVAEPVAEARTAEHRPWWQHRTLVVSVAVIVAVAAIATIVLTINGGDPAGSPHGPIDGTFAVKFGPATAPDGSSDQVAAGGDETWTIRSACGTAGCVATASRLDGAVSTASTLVLDEIAGRWQAVSASPGTCAGTPTEYWESMALRAQDDGSLTGQFTVRSTNGCGRDQQVTFTKTGDGNAAELPDPAAQPALVPSPAAALHGRYRETDTYASDARRAEATFDVRTYCLRTGDRCLSWWQSAADAKAMVFAAGKLVLANTTGSARCTSGRTARRETALEYPIPDLAQDPITGLTGRGRYTVTGDCPYNSDFESRVERTGD